MYYPKDWGSGTELHQLLERRMILALCERKREAREAMGLANSLASQTFLDY